MSGEMRVFMATLLGLMGCSQEESRTWTRSYLQTGDKPAWSPDGNTLVVSARIDGKYELVAIDLEAGREKRLTRDKAYAGSPNFSPDGRHVAFESTLGGDRAIYALELKNGRLARLAPVAEDSTQPRSPFWLSATVLGFVARDGGHSDLYRINVDGTDRRRLASDAAARRHPACSAAAKKIAFQAEATWPQRILAVNDDGTGEGLLASVPTSVNWPSWSPDGREIAMVVDDEGGSGIFVHGSSTGTSRRVSPPPGPRTVYWHPEWSPQGSWIAFNEHVGEVWGIAVVRPDGSGYRRLRESPKWEGHPVWSPEGSRIAFHSEAERAFFLLELESGVLRKIR